MLLKFLNGESKTIAGAAIVVGVLSFASRIVGLVRDRILAGEFGAGEVLDAYYAAFKVPDFVFNLLVVGALSASFIPLFTKYASRTSGMKDAWRLTNNTLNLIAIATVAVSSVMFVFAEPLSGLIAPGFPPDKQAMVAEFTRIMLLAEVLLGLSVVLGSVLQGMKRFFLYSLAPIFYNVGIIVGAVWLTDWFGEAGLAWGVVLGAFLHFLVQLYGTLELGYRYHFLADVQDRDAKEIMTLMGPRVVSIGIGQVNFLVMTVIASGLAAGSVTVFNFAYNIQFFPIGIIGVAYAVAAFPVLSEQVERGNMDKFISIFSATVRQILFLIIPMMLVFLILRAQIVRVVVGAGKFGWAETIVTADTLAFFSLSFFAQALVFLLARAFFALHDTATPLTAGVVSAVVNILASLYFVDLVLPGDRAPLGVTGLGIAFTIASIVNFVLLWIPLRTRTGSLDEFRIVQSLYKITTAALVAAVVMQSLKPVAVSLISLDTFFGVLAQGLFAGGIGLIAYGAVAWFLKSEEMIELVESVRKRIFRKSQPEEVIPPTA